MGAGARQPRRGRHRPDRPSPTSSSTGSTRLLDELAADLRDGGYRPLAGAPGVHPEARQADEQRPLSIPAVRDRVVQAAVKIVHRADLRGRHARRARSGFARGASAHDALQVLIDESWRGRRWVVETDIANCFEAIPHDGLMAAIEERIVDRQLLKLLRAMLRAGVMEDGAVTAQRDRHSAGRGDLAAAVPTSTCTGSTGSGRRAGTGCWSATPTICW